MELLKVRPMQLDIVLKTLVGAEEMQRMMMRRLGWRNGRTKAGWRSCRIVLFILRLLRHRLWRFLHRRHCCNRPVQLLRLLDRLRYRSILPSPCQQGTRCNLNSEHPTEGNCGFLDDVLKCWTILLIGTGGGTFPKEPATIRDGDDSGNTISSANFSWTVIAELYL